MYCREIYRTILTPIAEKRIKEKQCPNCGKPKSEWNRRTDWRCCSTKCTKEFWVEHDKSWSWETFRMQVFKRDKGICQTCKKKFTFIGYVEKEEIPNDKPEKLILEPILNNNIPKWLVVKTKLRLNTDNERNIKTILKENNEPEYETVFEIKEPGLWQCSKCGALTQNITQKPEICQEKDGGCGRPANFTPVTKIIKEGIWQLPIWKEQEVDVLDMYDSINSLVHDLVIFPEEMQYKLFNLWIISTWKLGNWETVGFPVFRGIISSGKTRALNIIRELAYRSVPASSATFAAIARLSHHWHVTLTIDEANNRLNKRTERGAELLDFVKQSYKRGSKYISANLNDQDDVIISNNFGFKAFAGERTFDPALVSRGMDFFMEKAEPSISKVEYATDEFTRLRTTLLNYRYKTSDPPDLGENYVLKGRSREVYESIISTGMHIGQTVDDLIEFVQQQEKESEEELQGTVQYDILRIIKDHQEIETLDDSPEEIAVLKIAEELGWTEKKDKQKLGYLLKNVGLKTKRKTRGKVIILTDRANSRRLGYLYRRYKLMKT